jgi:HlyD family secretion protein
MNETSSSDKHRETIIQTSATKSVRRPETKRQLRIVLYVLIVVAVAVAIAYLALRPENESIALSDYSKAVVEVRTIQDDLQLGGTVRARTEETVRTPVSGLLESILVDVGDWVGPGQQVAVLDAEDLQDALDEQRQNLVQSSRAYESMLLSREQALLLSSRVRESLQTDLTTAREDLDDARELHKLGSISAAALEDAEDAATAAEGALEDHNEDEDIAARFYGLSTLDNEDALADIRRIIADLEEQLEETTIISEMEGRVVWTIDIITAVGNDIGHNAAIMQIADTRDPFVETVIEEQYVGDIALGQEAWITIAGRDFQGVIERIGLLAATPADGGPPQVDLDLSVKVEDFEALPGGTALVELIVGVVPDALVIPRGPFLSTGNGLYLYRIDGTTAVRTQATFGAVTEQFVEIISGVSAGDEIITSSYQNYIDFEVISLGGKK